MFAAASHSAWARVKVADETRRAAPELSLRVVRDRNDFAEPYGNNIGVKLKIPFSSGSHVRREYSAAQAEAEKADAEMRQTEMRVRQEIERSRRALEAAERQLRMARAGANPTRRSSGAASYPARARCIGAAATNCCLWTP